MGIPEELVWRQIQQKNIKAFESYYKDHYKEFLLVSYNYVKAVSIAQEIVNDVFLKIWEDAEKINIEFSLKSYVYKAIINRSINALNKQKRELQSQKELAQLPPQVYELKEIEANELKVRLYEAIEKLPDQCRKVFLMSRMDGLKQQDIADTLGISIKTVKNHITHALKQLRKWSGYSAVVLLVLMAGFFSTLMGLLKIFRVL